MSRILVVYATNAGSTAKVAKAIAEELTLTRYTAVVSPVEGVKDLNGSDAVVVGAPMIFGWHADARKFLRRHRAELAGKKLSLFACAMRLTRVEGEALPDVPLALDPDLVSEPQQPGKLNFKERFTTTGHYLAPMQKAWSGAVPVSVAFFYGNLDMRKLK